MKDNLRKDNLKVTLTSYEERNYSSGGFESMLKRFNRAVQTYGILKEIKQRSFFVSKADKRQKKRMNKITKSATKSTIKGRESK